MSKTDKVIKGENEKTSKSRVITSKIVKIRQKVAKKG